MDREPDWIWWNEARAIARRHARGASDAADDLAQELAVAALEHGGAAARPGAWLERVGRNAVIDGWRVERRRRELAGDIDTPMPSPDPETRVLLRERRGVVRRALAELPRPLRRAALARFHADLPFDAVASRLGTEPVTARTRVHRALERLRGLVGGLRALFVWPPGAWLPGAQATVLGLTIIASVARPVPSPALAPPATVMGASASVEHPRRVAQVSVPLVAPAPPPARSSRPPAAPAPRADAPAPPPSVVQRFNYDDDEIAGELAGPDGLPVFGEPVIHQASLIELRWTFAPEILKTLEDL